MATHPAWNRNYKDGRFNRYPYDKVVSYFFRTFGVNTDHSNVSVLDFGCGGGTHAPFLKDEGFDYWGIDGSEEAIELTYKALGEELKFKDRIFKGDFCAMPFADNFFDAILDRQALGHNSWDDIKKICSEMYRILKPGGWYYGHIFSDNHPDLKFGDHLGNGDYGNFSEGSFFKAEFVHAFNAEQLHECFNSFEIESAVTIIEKNLFTNEATMEWIEVSLIKPKS